MTRTSSPSSSRETRLHTALTLVLCVCGCASNSALQFDSAAEFDEEEPRKAPGVAIDPTSELPSPASSAATTAGIAQLKVPPDASVARQIVKRFFESMLQGSFSDLEPLIDEQAWFNTGPRGGRQRARHFMQTRMARVDYTKLNLNSLYREAEVQTYRAQDIGALSPGRTLPRAIHGQDVLVRVFIATPRVGRTRLFGDEVNFVLRPTDEGFTVVEIVEDFQLP